MSYKNASRLLEGNHMRRTILITLIFVPLIGLVPTALADQNSYSFTVHVPSHEFGATAISIFIKTANGYTDQQDVSTGTGDISWTFNVPPNQGDTIQVCVHTAGILNVIGQNCKYRTVNQEAGSYSVSMRSP